MRRVFVIATLVALIHGADDAFVHRGPGLGLGQHALAELIALAAGAGAIIAFPRLRPGLRAALAFSLGVLAVANGSLHLGHIGRAPSRSRPACWRACSCSPRSPWASSPRTSGASRSARRGARRPRRQQRPQGLRPSRGAPGPPRLRRPAYDARGRGESDGSENNYGWDWAKDISGALEYLKAREDVDPDRIGAVGLSTGADALIDAAPERTDIAALVTDGAAGSFADWDRLRGTELGTVPGWVMYSTIRVLSGDPPSRPLEDQIQRIAEFNVLYDEAAGDGPVEHWNLPGGHHTQAIHEYPGDYERRVASFFDRAL